MKHKFINILKSETDIEINTQFQKAINLALDSFKNIFITGKAGTGKSTLLNLIRIQTEKKIVVIAPTGLAALNVSGQTIHSFFKFSPNVTTLEAIEIGKKRAKDRVVKNLEMIIIDEISMVRADLLDCVDLCLKYARGNTLPFGGVQIVLIGDLYQLPPVLRNEDKENFNQIYSSPYFFGANVMQELMKSDLFDTENDLELIELEKIYRQSDSDFIEILNAVRGGNKTLEVLNKLNQRVLNISKVENAIILTTTNQGADEINKNNLESLKADFEIYTGQIKGDFSQRDLPTSQALELRVGARVMFVKNDSKGNWVNGTLGVVKELFDDGVSVLSDDGQILEVYPETWEIYQTKYNTEENRLENEVVGSFIQLPLKLAWAITIHKSQGQTFDKIILDLKHRAFSAGQTYVALSRCRTLEGLYLTQEIKSSDIRTDSQVISFLNKWQYLKSKKNLSNQAKTDIINQAINTQAKLQILYLKADTILSSTIILPHKLESSKQNDIEFMRLEAFCYTKDAKKIFNFDRILEVIIVD